MGKLDRTTDGTHGLPALITSREFAELWGTTPDYVARMRVEKRGPRYIQANRSVRYRLSDVLAWLDANTVSTSESAQ